MKRCAILLCAALALLVSSEIAQAGWGSLHYGGYQPWWNVFAHRNRNLTCEEERLQRFWHDYYDALRRYYDLLDNIDWVAYYKNHGYEINNRGCGYPGCGPCGGAQRVQYAPVFVSPTMMWAVPNATMGAPPTGPMPPNPAMFNQGGHGGPPAFPGYPGYPSFPGYPSMGQ